MAKLPKDFLWGGAIAAHQAEGGWDAGGKIRVQLIEVRNAFKPISANKATSSL